MDAPNVLETVGAELASKKAETKSMARRLRAKKLAVKWSKREMQRIKRVNKLKIAMNRRMQKLVEDFLVAAEAENNDPGTAKIWTEKAMREGIKLGMNDLNLEGNNIITVNQVSYSCTSGSAADGAIKTEDMAVVTSWMP